MRSSCDVCSAFNTKYTLLISLYHFKKVYKQIHSKELHLVEQGLCELKAKKTKIDFNSTGEQTAHTPVVDLPISSPPKVHQSPSANGFIFNPSFFVLPDLFFYNT